jgi:hypothetical protein
MLNELIIFSRAPISNNKELLRTINLLNQTSILVNYFSVFNTKKNLQRKNILHQNHSTNPGLLNKTLQTKRHSHTILNQSTLKIKKMDVNMSWRTQKKCTNYFAHTFIDRSSDKRKDAKWIQEQIKSDQAVFVLFHVDKPFVKINDAQKMYSLCKFSCSDVSKLLDANCTHVFLGVEYENNEQVNGETQNHNNNNNNNDDLNNGDCYNSVCISPYSNPDLYNRDKFRSWFAIDSSKFDQNIENIVKLYGSNQGEFFEGSFLRLMAIQDIQESSIIAQVNITSFIDFFKYSYVK